jgi:hypothetical protein
VKSLLLALKLLRVVAIVAEGGELLRAVYEHMYISDE